MLRNYNQTKHTWHAHNHHGGMHHSLHFYSSINCQCKVKQLLAADGRLHLDFNIVSTGSSQNYTHSYYMNGDYIISGSCDENVVRICCAQTGRRLRDISLEVNYYSCS